MFINSKGGYGRNGEQFARGSFLLLFSHNGHKWEDQNNRARVEDHGQMLTRGGDSEGERFKCQCRGSGWRPEYGDAPVPSYYLKYCPAHGHEYKTWAGDDKKLYACLRHVSLRQLGHFMMGTARIAGQSVTVSGAYGADGLPRDYEELTEAGRAKLTEVPVDVAAAYWAGDGWNGAGKEAPVLRAWALRALRVDAR